MPRQRLLLIMIASAWIYFVKGQCLPGTYANNTTNSSSCLPSGYSSDAGSSKCWIQCPAGQIPDGNTDSGLAAFSYCMSCPVGSYSSIGVSSCTLCNASDPSSTTTGPSRFATSSYSCSPICLTGYSNVALGKNVSVDSGPGASSAAVDGVIGPWDGFSSYEPGPAVRAAYPNSWLQIDLGSSYLVSSVYIWQRTDCEWASCSARISNVVVTVGSLSDGSQNAVCFSQNKAWGGVLGINLTCNSPLIGRYMRVKYVPVGFVAGFVEVAVCGTLSPPQGYIGCYSDSVLPSMSTSTVASPGQPARVARLLPYALVSGSGDSSLTISSCKSLAQQAGLPYFGLQYGQECYGGTDLSLATSNGVSTNCNMACRGNSSQLCGGPSANSIYVTANVTYIGCYAESDKMNRRMTYQLFAGYGATTSSDNSIGVCNFFALSRGLRYFGIQSSSQCWATNDLNMALSDGSSSSCNMACSGNPSQTCGGSYVNSIYRTFTPPPPSPGAILCPTSSGCIGFDLSPSLDGICGTGPSSYNPSCVNCPFGVSSLNGSATCWQSFIPSSSPGVLVSLITGTINASYSIASDVNLLVNGSYANGAAVDWYFDMGGATPFLCTSCPITSSTVSWIMVVPQTGSPIDQPQAAIFSSKHYDIKMILVTVSMTNGVAYASATAGRASLSTWSYLTPFIVNAAWSSSSQYTVATCSTCSGFGISHLAVADTTGYCSNFALGRPTSQSSTLGLASSSLAVDGLAYPFLAADGSVMSCSRTAGSEQDHQPWWTVDLGSLSPVAQIFIKNRGDGYSSQLQNLQVRLGDVAVAAGSILNNQIIFTSNASYTGCDLVIALPSVVFGRYISIQVLGSPNDSYLSYLNLCEVKVCPTFNCICGDVNYPNSCPPPPPIPPSPPPPSVPPSPYPPRPKSYQSNSASSPPSSSSSSSSKNVVIGAVVGGVIGGLALIGLIALFLIRGDGIKNKNQKMSSSIRCLIQQLEEGEGGSMWRAVLA